MSLLDIDLESIMFVFAGRREKEQRRKSVSLLFFFRSVNFADGAEPYTL